MFQLTAEEAQSLTSQFAISNRRGGRRTLPYAFTEHGAPMLLSVLNSDRAIQMDIEIIRAFVKLRQILAAHTSLARIEKVEATQKDHSAVLSPTVGQPTLAAARQDLPAHDY